MKRKRGPSSERFTLSVAISSLVIQRVDVDWMKTYIAGQIARSCVIFCVDEVIVFDEEGSEASKGADAFLARILQYAEMPQYLRKALIPLHPDLKQVGVLLPLVQCFFEAVSQRRSASTI